MGNECCSEIDCKILICIARKYHYEKCHAPHIIFQWFKMSFSKYPPIPPPPSPQHWVHTRRPYWSANSATEKKYITVNTTILKSYSSQNLQKFQFFYAFIRCTNVTKLFENLYTFLARFWKIWKTRNFLALGDYSRTRMRNLQNYYCRPLSISRPLNSIAL